MGIIKIKKGLNLPIQGDPEQIISEGRKTGKTALIGFDYPGMKPAFAVSAGDRVKKGQLLFTDKKMPEVRYTSPGCGTVSSINRGIKRVFESIVIELNGEEETAFRSYAGNKLDALKREDVRSLLLESGEWTSIRQRPYGKVADPAVVPRSVFVTAMDTNPLAASVEKVLEGKEEDFNNGLRIISKLTDGKVYVCKSPSDNIKVDDIPRVSVEEFSGPHPAGLAGTHIHFLDPVGPEKKVWHIGFQDVIAVGNLFTTGRIFSERIISLAGPRVLRPRLLRTRTGASVSGLVEGELKDGGNRVISGSVFNGRTASGPTDYLGRFHSQITVLREGRERKFLGWMAPGFNLFSVKNILISSLFRKKMFDLTTSLEGGKRAIIPVENYEKVMPLDILPVYLLRALSVDDIDEAVKLGCLELIEEDLALCTFVCAAKNDYGAILRRNLTIIEKEG